MEKDKEILKKETTQPPNPPQKKKHTPNKQTKNNNTKTDNKKQKTNVSILKTDVKFLALSTESKVCCITQTGQLGHCSQMPSWVKL